MRDTHCITHPQHQASVCCFGVVKADNILGRVSHEILAEEPEFVYIKWQEPKSPNGMIILYEVNYHRLSDNEVSAVTPPPPHTQ